LRPDGRANVGAILREVLANRDQVLPLLRLAGDAFVARGALFRLRRLLGPGFGITDIPQGNANGVIQRPLQSPFALRS
jgi:hypothetical protein